MAEPIAEKFVLKRALTKLARFSACAIVVSLAFFAGWRACKMTTFIPDDTTTDVREGGFKFISPLLDSEQVMPTKRKDLDDLKVKLQAYIDDSIRDPSVSRVRKISLYYRELQADEWFGINENDDFSPASLLKMPLMLAYFKKAESDPNFLDQEVEYHATQSGYTQNVTPEKSLIEGKTYKLSELIEQMIIYSDNQTYSYLYHAMDEADRNIAYSQLSIHIPDLAKTDDFMSVKEYSRFFRILYNASYLNQGFSEKALELMTRVQFEKGIVAGVPKDVLVAHKFGERGVEDGHTFQLHDCGIVYVPKKPYLLCVMSRGNDLESQEKSLQSISTIVYENVTK